MSNIMRNIKIIASDMLRHDCVDWIVDIAPRLDKVSRVFKLGSLHEVRVHVYETVKLYHESPIGTSAKAIIKSDKLPPWFLGNTNADGIHIVSRIACDLQVDGCHMDETLTHEYTHACTHKEFPTVNNVPDRWYIECIAVYLSGRISSKASRKDAPSYDQLSKGMKYYYYGHYVCRFIENQFGVDGLTLLLANNCSVNEAFGITDEVFNRGWHALLPDGN